jgi:hypothetical protein
MLWDTLVYKGWLETRFRLLFTLSFMVLLLALTHSSGTVAPAPGARSPIVGIVLFSNPTFVVMICAMLAGAGIATQPSFQAVKGIHGSTLFTLSLPVSRFRLLAVRATLGWLEMAGAIGTICCGMWFASSQIRSSITVTEMFEYAVTLIACGSTLYFLSVLIATFLDDQWRVWGTMIAAGALWWLSSRALVPASADIFRAMGEGSPLIAHAMPWTAMASSLGLAAILFFAALKIAQSREY